MANVNKTVDVAALDLLCEKLDCGDANHRATAEQIRKAMKGVKPQLPEGIEWPRFEDGELVKFVDKFVYDLGMVDEARHFHFYDDEFHLNCVLECDYGEPVKRPEPEVLDADGVPIKVGDTVYATFSDRAMAVERIDKTYVYHDGGFTRADSVTHRKPDTFGDIEDDATMSPQAYYEKHIGHEAVVMDAAELTEAMCKHLIQRTREVCERGGKLMGGE